LQVTALEDRAGKIQDIASWVMDIANQTNLLSLNASIEAARAGEQGRGFAVVASEVKKLAQQTTHSVESITELTQGTIVEVDRIAESIGNIDTLTVDIEDKTNSVELLFRTITDSIESNRDMNKHIEDELVHLLMVMEEIAKSNETIAAASEKMDGFMRKI
jgi:methyl-accepting chemotaxis protein